MIYLIPYNLSKDKHTSLFHVNGLNFWYLHGILQDHFNYDKADMYVDYDTKCKICEEIKGNLYIKEGIYDVIIERYDKPCQAYMWQSKMDNIVKQRGIVVDTSCKKDVKYAKEKLNKKPVII